MLAAACGDGAATGGDGGGAGADAPGTGDAGTKGDAGVKDGGIDDGGGVDGGKIDAGPTDAGTDDAGSPDVQEEDIGVDSGADDAGIDDVGTPDAGPFDAGGARCDQGGQTAGSSGLEAPFGEAVVGLCRMALGCPAQWKLARPPESYHHSGTPNHKLLWRVWYYGWARLAGTPAELDDARSFLISFYTTQEQFGHQAISAGANEVLNTSHYQIWTNGKTCARLLAVRYADRDLLDATGEWWRHETALYDALQRGGSIDAPGARFKEGQAGPSQLRDVIYAMIMGWPLSGSPGNQNAAWWDQYYNVSAWTLRELLRMGDDLGGAKKAGPADLPKLSDPLHLYTNGADYVFVFPKLTGALEPLFWVARLNGQTTYAPYVAGTPGDNPDPPPDLPGAQEQIIPGVQ